MRFSRQWSPQIRGAPFGGGPALKLRADGYPASLPEGAWAESALISFEGKHPWPVGDYTVLYKGQGDLSFGKAESSRKVIAPGCFVARLNRNEGNLHLIILKTNPADPIRDIQVVLPGLEKNLASNPWNPSFLARWRGVACLRFMDFMATNNSSIENWEDRPKPGDFTYAGRGVPVEFLVDLSNRLRVDPWFCMPHMATDDYIGRFAEYVRDHLDPGLKVHIEYSNEVWNRGFQQNAYAAREGLALGLANVLSEAAWPYTAKRSLEMFAFFENVFGGRDRLVRILPMQAGNLYMAGKILEFEEAWKQADAIAIAPYVGLNVAGTPDKYTSLLADKVATWDAGRILARLRNEALPATLANVRYFKKLAWERKLDLIAYEGGQHLVGIRGAENNTALTELFFAANADPAMGGIYDALFKGWTDEGGSLFCHFSSVARWTKWGSWGALQYYDDDPARSPKFMALRRWATACGQELNPPRT